MRYLRNLTDADTMAARTLAETDPETMRDLLGAVVRIVTARKDEHADDVVSLAACTAPRLLIGAESVDHAAASAVAHARRDVARAYFIAGWDTYGDMSDAVNDRDALGDTVTTYRSGSDMPRPDSIADATPADFLASIGRHLTGRAAERWQAVVTAWLAHDEDDCPDCDRASGRRVSPRGVVAHVTGVTPDDSAYHAEYRRAVAALTAARPVVAALVDTYSPRPAGRARQGRAVDPRTPVTRRHAAPVALVNGRTMTPAERFGADYPACRAMRSHRAEDGTYAPCDCPATVRHAGEEYGRSSAPYSPGTAAPFTAARPAPGGRAVTPGTPVPSHKPVVSPRKRPGSNTGPTVRAF